MIIEYLGVKEINGSLIALDGIKDASYEETVTIRLENGTERDGRIVQIDGDRVVIQVFEGTNGISLDNTRTRLMGHPVEMPPKELEVLYFLASHQNRVFTREQLLEQVWGFDFFGDSRTVDVHIKRLREKLQGSEALGWQIRTVWGVGYKFEVK